MGDMEETTENTDTKTSADETLTPSASTGPDGGQRQEASTGPDAYGVTADGRIITQHPDGSRWELTSTQQRGMDVIPYNGDMPTGPTSAAPPVPEAPLALPRPLNPDMGPSYKARCTERENTRITREIAAAMAALDAVEPAKVAGITTDPAPQPQAARPAPRSEDQGQPIPSEYDIFTPPADDPLTGRAQTAARDQDQHARRERIAAGLRAQGLDPDELVPVDQGDGTFFMTRLELATPTSAEDLAASPLQRTLFAAVNATTENAGLTLKLAGNAVADFVAGVEKIVSGEAGWGPPGKPVSTPMADAVRSGANALGADMRSGVAEALKTVRQSYRIEPQGFGEQVAQVVTEIAPFFAGTAAATSAGGPAAGYAFGVAWFGAKTRESLLEQGATERQATLGGLANGVATVLSFRTAGWASNAMAANLSSEFRAGATGEAGARTLTALTNALVIQASPFIDSAVQAITLGQDVTQAVENAWTRMRQTLGRDFLANLVASAFMGGTGKPEEQGVHDPARLFYPDASGPARPKSLAEAVTDVFKGKTPASLRGEQQTLMLLGGMTGAGKSSFTNTQAYAQAKEHSVLADADGLKQETGRLGDADHAEHSAAATEAMWTAIDGGYHTIYDSPLSNFPKAERAIEAVLAKAGRASVVFVDTSPENAAPRIIQREKETGRDVPASAVAESHNQGLPSFLELFRKYKGDPRVDFELHDNNGERSKLVFRQVDGKIEVLDQGLFDRLQDTTYHKNHEGKYERDNSSQRLDEGSADRLLQDARDRWSRQDSAGGTGRGGQDRSGRDSSASGLETPLKDPASSPTPASGQPGTSAPASRDQRPKGGR